MAKSAQRSRIHTMRKALRSLFNRRNASGKLHSQKRRSVGGVFFKVESEGTKAVGLERHPSTHLSSTTTTITTTTTTIEDTDTESLPSPTSSTTSSSWKSTDTHSFHRGQPLIVNDPESPEELQDEEQALGLVMQRSRRLPGTWYYSSNHILVNDARTRQMIAPLTRLLELDDIARHHAKTMADAEALFHSNPETLRSQFQRPSRRMGENVARGESIRRIHRQMMATASDKHNILHRRYTHMGMGTAKGADDQLYLCQIFRG